MTEPAFLEEPILKTRRLRCDYIQAGAVKVFRFAGLIVAEDWRAIRALYSHLTGVTGGCVLDISDVLLFDSTLYSVLVWARLTRELHDARFALVAGESAERRLMLAGIGKWMPVFRTLAEAREELFTPRVA